MTQESRLRAYLESSPDGIFVVDAEGRIEYVSRRGIGMLMERSPQGLSGHRLTDFVAPEDRDRAIDLLRRAHLGPTELRLLRPDGDPLWVEINAEQVPDPNGPPALVLVARDASQRKRSQEELIESHRQLLGTVSKLEQMAATDGLTGLWNRRHFERVAAAEIARCRRYSQIVSLILLDVDRFKSVNDRFGHDMGDRVLAAVAGVVAATVREMDVCCRWGGEEFVVLAPAMSAVNAGRLADRIRKRVAEHDPGAPVGRVTVSAGVAQLDPAENLEQWLRRADQALYRAKAGGRNRVELSGAPSDTAEHRLVQLVWDAGYECGNALIDEQHRRLFVLANALLDAGISHAPAAAMRQRFSELFDHLAAHFADEEQLLERVDYSERAQHATLHASLVEEARRLGARVDSGSLDMSELVRFLVITVVRDHLAQADTLFFPAVAVSGNRPAP